MTINPRPPDWLPEEMPQANGLAGSLPSTQDNPNAIDYIYVRDAFTKRDAVWRAHCEAVEADAHRRLVAKELEGKL